MTVHEFWRAWHGADDGDDFVRYSWAALAAFGLAAADCAFLAEAGLPAWAAPHMHFFARAGVVLPAPEDPYGKPYPCAPAEVAMIGSAEAGWPLCLDRSRPGTVVWLHPEQAPAGIIVNSTPRRLGASLLAYNQTVEEALRYGEAAGEADAWRRRRYPTELDRRLWGTLRAIDPAVATPNNFWARHVHLRLGDT